MKINLQRRLKNKAFWVSMAGLVVGFVYQVLGMLGIVPSVSQNTIIQTIGIVLNMLGMLGVLVDPTTPGVSDSTNVLNDVKTDTQTEQKLNVEAINLEPDVVAEPIEKK